MNSVSFLEFFQTFPSLNFDAGERIMRPMEHATNMIYVKSGSIRVYLYTKDGREVSLDYLSEKQYKHLVFGFSSLLKEYSIEALTDVELWKIPKNVFIEFLEENPEANRSFIEGFYGLIKDLLLQIEWLKHGNSNFRIITFLEILANDFSHTKNHKLVIDFKITHQMIADYTGLTRETVSIRLKKLKEKKIIDYDDTFLTIPNVLNLKKELEE